MPQRTNAMHCPPLPQRPRKEVPRRKVGGEGGRMVPTRPGAPGSPADAYIFKDGKTCAGLDRKQSFRFPKNGKTERGLRLETFVTSSKMPK